MKKIAKILTILFLFLSSFSFVSAKNINTKGVSVVSVASDETVKKDFFLVSGEVVEIKGKVEGDVIAAGGQIIIDGVIDGDLLAIGGTIDISGEIEQDVRIVGGQIFIGGRIGRNLTVAGGNVEIKESSEIEGGALLTGGNVFVNGPVGGDVLVGAGNLNIANKVGGNVEAAIGTLRLTSNAEILGDLVYFTDQDPLIDQEASVSGKVVKKQTPEQLRTQDFPKIREIIKEVGKRRIETNFISLLAALLFGLLMIRFYPNYTREVAKTVRNEPWRSLGIGFLVLILAPTAFLILVITIIGLPIGMIIFFTYIVYIYLAKIFIASCIGSYVYEKLNKKETKYLPFIIGVLIYYLLRIPPVLGSLTGFVVLLLGLGAAVIQYKEFYKKALKHKVI